MTLLDLNLRFGVPNNLESVSEDVKERFLKDLSDHLTASLRNFAERNAKRFNMGWELKDETVNSSTTGMAEGALEIYESLSNALTTAHGTPLSVDTLSKTSALDLLIYLGVNNIRFVYDVHKFAEAASRWPRMKDGTYLYIGMDVEYVNEKGTITAILEDGFVDFKRDGQDGSRPVIAKELYKSKG